MTNDEAVIERVCQALVNQSEKFEADAKQKLIPMREPLEGPWLESDKRLDAAIEFVEAVRGGNIRYAVEIATTYDVGGLIPSEWFGWN